MSLFGEFYWGDGTKWGAGESANLAWGVEVDWNGDGVFDGSNEADRLMEFSSTRGRKTWLATTDGFSDVETGNARITLDNSDGRFDPWNTASPLYPHVRDGREVRVRVRDLDSGTTYPLFYGVITDIQASGFDNNPAVVLRVEDGMRNLRRTDARVAMSENITPDAAIGLVLDAVQWPARWGRDLDSAADNIRYFWSRRDVLAATELERLAQSFLAYFFVTASGKARYLARTNTESAVADLQEASLSKDIQVNQPWEYRRNITRIRTHPLSVATGQTLWEMIGSAPAIESGTDLVLWANYTYNSQAVSGKNITPPAPTTDWTANTSSSGGGTDKTGEVTLSFSNLGDTAKLVFRYTGGGTIYLTSAKIRGDALYEISSTDVTYPAQTSTVSDPREFLLDLPWQQDINVARDFVAVMGPFLETAHPFPVVRLDTRPNPQFLIDLFDMVTVTIGKVGVNGVPYRVGSIEHQTQGPTCQRVVTTLYLEPYIAGGTFWTWPIANFGVDTIFGW